MDARKDIEMTAISRPTQKFWLDSRRLIQEWGLYVFSFNNGSYVSSLPKRGACWLLIQKREIYAFSPKMRAICLPIPNVRATCLLVWAMAICRRVHMYMLKYDAASGRPG